MHQHFVLLHNLLVTCVATVLLFYKQAIIINTLQEIQKSNFLIMVRKFLDL